MAKLSDLLGGLLGQCDGDVSNCGSLLCIQASSTEISPNSLESVDESLRLTREVFQRVGAQRIGSILLAVGEQLGVGGQDWEGDGVVPHTNRVTEGGEGDNLVANDRVIERSGGSEGLMRAESTLAPTRDDNLGVGTLCRVVGHSSGKTSCA